MYRVNPSQKYERCERGKEGNKSQVSVESLAHSVFGLCCEEFRSWAVISGQRLYINGQDLGATVHEQRMLGRLS